MHKKIYGQYYRYTHVRNNQSKAHVDLALVAVDGRVAPIGGVKISRILRRRRHAEGGEGCYAILFWRRRNQTIAIGCEANGDEGSKFIRWHRSYFLGELGCAVGLTVLPDSYGFE